MNRIAVFVVFGLGLAVGTAEAADRAAVTRGKQVFREYGCWKCHGTAGQGSGAGLKLAPEPLPLDAMITFLRGTTGPMPRYAEVLLSDAQVADIHAYLESQPKSQSPDKIPALKDLKLAN